MAQQLESIAGGQAESLTNIGDGDFVAGLRSERFLGCQRATVDDTVGDQPGVRAAEELLLSRRPILRGRMNRGAEVCKGGHDCGV